MARYFEKTAETYKGGIYRDLPEFQDTYHYHNDWIEIRMHLGLRDMMTYVFFLWSWFQTLRRRQLAVLAAALLCFIFLSGLTDTLVFFRQTFYLLLVITAIGITCHNASEQFYSTKYITP